MKFTPAQCREAFYKAAANIEARPELYEFTRSRVGDGDCPACMWGHVGRVLRMGSHVKVGHGVPRAIGFSSDAALYSRDIFESGFDHPKSKHYSVCEKAAAARLRAFADHHWPAESTEPVRPDLKECGMSFSELLQHINGEIA